VRTLYVRRVVTRFNVFTPGAIRRQRESGLRLLVGAVPLIAAVLVACAPKPEPRSVIDFMEDGLARDGVLTRCNQDRDATSTDEECANARRAAAAVALEAERARAEQRGSEAEIVALRGGAPTFDVYADEADALRRPTLEISAAEPPSNELVIERPRLELTDLTVTSRPFRDDASRQ
jgi:hypothetical protein